MPMIRIILPFLAGILSYNHGIYYPIWILSFILSFLVIAIIIIPARPGNWREHVWLKSTLIKAGLCLTSWILSYVHDIRNRSNWFAGFHADTIILRLSSEPSAGKFYKTATADILFVQTTQKWQEVKGKSRVRLPADTHFSEGDVLLTTGKVHPIPDTGPQKSFARYLAIQGIYHDFRPNRNQLILLAAEKNRPDRIGRIRDQILNILDSYFTLPEVRGLAKALLVGYRGELEKELSLAYSKTGVVHVIAISGLHLGLIYGLLLLILRPLSHLPGFRISGGLLILIVLWIFTLVCGASPSVVRSAIMFSFLITGNIIHSRPMAGNMLAASALVMLIANPMVVYDIGFQLSYAAVGSLLVYNKAISSLYTPDNGILAMAWSSISTSLSAQILTTPFVLYHFHQFPLLFLLANLVAIPLSGIALLLLILICALFLLSIPAHWVAIATEWTIRLMNDRVLALAGLPFGLWEAIPFSISSLICSLLFIGSITTWLTIKKQQALQASLVILIIWGVITRYSSG